MAIRKKSAFEEALDFVGKGVQNFASGAGQAVSNVAKTAGNFYNNFSNDYNNQIKLRQAQDQQNRIKAQNFTKNIINTVGNEFQRDAQNFQFNTKPIVNTIKPVFTKDYWNPATPETNYQTGQTVPKFWSDKNIVAKGLADAQRRLETGKLIDTIKVAPGDSLPANLINMGVNIPGALINSVYGQGVTAPTSDIMHIATDPFRYGTDYKYNQLNSGAAKIGMQIAGKLNPSRVNELGIKEGLPETIGNIAQTVNPIIDAWGGGQLFKIGKAGFVGEGRQILSGMLKGGANALIPGGASVMASSLSANRNKGSVGEQVGASTLETAQALPLIFVGGAAFHGLGALGSKLVQKMGPEAGNFMINKAPIADYLDGKVTPEVKTQLDHLNGGDISTGQGKMWDFLREAFPEHFDENGVPKGSLSGEIKKLNVDSPDDLVSVDNTAREQMGVPQDEMAFRRQAPAEIDGIPYTPRNKIGHVIEPADYGMLEDALYYLKSAQEKGNIEAYLDPKFTNSEAILKEVGGDYLGRNFTKTQPIENVMAAVEERLNFDRPDVLALQKKLQAQQIDEGLSNNMLADINNNPAAKMIKDQMDQALTDTGTQITPREEFRTGPTAGTDFNMSTKDAEAAVKSMVGDAELQYINGGKQIVTPDGQLAHGKYYDSIISVVEQNGKVQDKTVYHEAFHAYVDKFVDKSLYKTALDDIIANEKLTEKQASEQLAEGFAEYMGGRREGFTGTIVQFFADLLTSIRTLMGKESAANMMYENVRTGNRTPNQGSAPVNVANTAYADTIKNGGVTISLAGGQPAEGFAYSPYKGVETIVPKEQFNPQNIRDFVAKNQELLSQPGNHIGMWEDNGQIYMDISQVGPANAETLAKAQEANQLAAFDLGTFEEIPLGTIENGVYNKTYEAVNHPYLNRGQDTAANPTGDGAGVPEVPPSESTSGTDTASGNTTSRTTPEEFFRKVKNGETPPIDEVPTPEEVIASIKEIQGEKPAPEPAQPKAGQKKRGFVETVQADASVPDAIKQAMDADPRIFYDTYTNQGILDTASKEIANDAHKVTAEVLDGAFPTSGIQQAELVAKTVGLAQEAIKAGKNDLAEELIINGAMRATPLAQGLQAFSLWNRVTPEGMLKYGLKEVEKANEGKSILRSLGITGKAEIKPETRDAIIKIMQEAQKMTDGPEKAAKIKEAVKLIGDSIPLTASEIFDAFRYQNLLSNPLTHLRNFYGNNLQGILLKPATTLVEGGLDLVQSSLTGRERKTYMSEVPTYYKGMINAVPLALERLKNSITQDVTITQPDLRSIRQERMPKALTVVPRFLEAADHFFSTIIEEGEYAAQRAKGINDATARKSSHELAQKYLFRNELDVKNKTGQGTVLTSFDKATSAMYKARNMELFGIKPLSWFVPFLKTPMNIAKMQIEYSPLGYSTMIGNTNKTQAFAKASIGTAVSGVGALFAFGGRTTWAAPVDPKEKELFYASGRRPYSVLVNTPAGERWVPMQFLGPLATAFAIPAAMKYYNDESKTALTDSQMQKAEKIAMGLVRQYSSNTFLTGLGNFLQVAEGNTDVNLETVGASLLGQAIPLNGLVSYVSRVVDPVYRKPGDFGEQLKSTIPFLSKSVPSYEDINGQQAERQQDLPLGLRSANTLPYGLGKPQDGGIEALYRNRQGQLQLNNLNNYNLKQIEKGGKVKIVDGKIAGVKGSETGDGDFLMTQLAPDKTDYSGLAPETVRKMKRSHDFEYATTLQKLAKDGTITPELLDKELQRKGITKEDIIYDAKTKLSDDVQLDQIKGEIDGLTGNEYLAKLVEMRRVSEGSRKALLSDTLVGKLEKEGYISSSEADYLKSIGWDDKKKTFTKIAGTGKGKKIDFKIDVKYPDINPPKGIASSLGKGITEAYTPIKLKRSDALKIQLPLSNPKYEPGQLPSGKVSAQIRPMAKTLSQLGQI